MTGILVRVGTVYIPVTNVALSAKWYADSLGAVCKYQDGEKAILDFANQSFFLVRSEKGQLANFADASGVERFSLTFEVDGLAALRDVHNHLRRQGVRIGDIENRGHAGRNFVFTDPDGNKFDVWSELSPDFKAVQPTM
ncbi:VOC family protein [Indiicoccus explosivorum]|uniref:VOC family protein n=1 Tax=Indiicoccus explosivorum TaxID=1917864 RepID=UPI000B4328D4|nr:VOC family protein [Indiicoccus explosivorum]